MTIKLNFLVIAMISLIFVLIVNADEANETYNQNNNNNSYDTATLELKESLGAELTADHNIPSTIIETNENEETPGKAVSASFGVWLTIVG